jgi:CheY-like chemotaxis protein
MEPSGTESPHPPASDPRNSVEASGTAPRILLVDGDPVRRRYTALLLERLCGVRPQEVGNAGAALALDRACDLVLLDMDAAQAGGIDGADGLEPLRRMAQCPGRPLIVAVSGDGSGPGRASCLAAGADHHRYRPLTRPLLADVLRHAGWGGAATDDFNAAAWAELVRVFKPAGAAEMARTLAADAPLQQHRYADAAAAGDLAALGRIAHTLRGISLQLGAQALAEECAQMEYAAAAGERATALQRGAGVLARHAALVERLCREARHAAAAQQRA